MDAQVVGVYEETPALGVGGGEGVEPTVDVMHPVGEGDEQAEAEAAPAGEGVGSTGEEVAAGNKLGEGRLEGVCVYVGAMIKVMLAGEAMVLGVLCSHSTWPVAEKSSCTLTLAPYPSCGARGTRTMLATGSVPATENTIQGSSSLGPALAHPEGLPIPLSTPEVHTSHLLARDHVDDPVQGCPDRRLTPLPP